MIEVDRMNKKYVIKLYALYKRLMLDPEAQIGWKWEEKVYSTQVVAKIKQGELYKYQTGYTLNHSLQETKKDIL